MPQRLIVSAANAPARRNAPRGLHTMNDDDLIEALREFNGTPPAVMKYRELLLMAPPMIRADFSISENYRYYHAPQLDLPLSAWLAARDPLTSAVQIDAWANETSGSCSIHWFDGDHFFINEEEAAVLAIIRASVGVHPV